jgi:aspartate dehydrogenase
MRVALIGLGAIGSVIARELLSRGKADIELVAALCQHESEGAHLPIPVFTQLQPLLGLKPDIVVEAAGHGAISSFGPACLAAGCDLLVGSVGALADDELRARLEQAASAAGRQLLLPSGALGGLDYLQAARLAGLSRVCLRTRKPPLAWLGTPAAAAFDLASLNEATVIFQGNAREAARLYPKNANVAATLALCTLGLDHTEVQLVADPGVSENIHEVEASGAAGEMELRLRNHASPDNPKTSLVTGYSLLRTLMARRAVWSV